MRRLILFIPSLFVAFVLLFTNLFTPSPKYELSVIGIFQNEAIYLKEWIDFHKKLGVDHFLLFNHLSNDSFQEVLSPYIKEGVVELIDWPYPSIKGDEADWNRIQTNAYTLAINSLKGISRFVMVIDTDEFLYPMEKNSLKEFLKSFPAASGILVNWQVFGTGGVSFQNDGEKLTEKLHLKAPQNDPMNTFCKSIFRPDRVSSCKDPHNMTYYPWTFPVDPNHNIFAWKFHKFHPPVIDKVRINHYWSRDETFFQKRKLARYDHWGSQREALIERNSQASLVEDHAIDRHLNR